MERLVAVDNHIKMKFKFKSTIDDLFNDDMSVLEHIHGGFRFDLNAEIVSNIKTALIEQMKKSDNE
jgi:hypothetical protein